MIKILGIIVLGLLLNGNAYAGVNEPGTSRLSETCKIKFDKEIKKIVNKKKKKTVVLYASCDRNAWAYAINNGKDLKKLHNKTFKNCVEHAKKHTGKKCFLYAVNNEVVWKYDKEKELAKIAEAKVAAKKQRQLDKRKGRFFVDQPDVNDDYQIHFIYIISKNGNDREWDINGKMENILTEMNEIMLHETAKKSKAEGQKYKFDYRKDGKLDITFIRLPKNLEDLDKFRNDYIAPFLWMNKFNNPKKIYYTFADMSSKDGGEAGVPMGSTYLGWEHITSVEDLKKITLHELHHAQGGGFVCVPGMAIDSHWKDYTPDTQLEQGFALGATYIHEEEGCPQLINSVYLTPTSKDPYDPFKLLCLKEWGKYNHPKLVKARDQQAKDYKNGKWNYNGGGSHCKFGYRDFSGGSIEMKLLNNDQVYSKIYGE